MQTATALSMGEPLQDPTPEQVLIERYADVVTGINVTGRHVLHMADTRDLSRTDELIKMHAEAIELLQCLAAHGGAK